MIDKNVSLANPSGVLRGRRVRPRSKGAKPLSALGMEARRAGRAAGILRSAL